MVKCSLQSTCGLVGQNSGEFGADPVYHNPDINFAIKAFVFILQLFKFKYAALNYILNPSHVLQLTKFFMQVNLAQSSKSSQ